MFVEQQMFLPCQKTSEMLLSLFLLMSINLFSSLLQTTQVRENDKLEHAHMIINDKLLL